MNISGSGEHRPSAANVRSIRAVLLVLLAACTVSFETAHGQFLFWPHRGYWWGSHPPSRHGHRHRHAAPPLAKKEPAQDVRTDPLQIIISIPDQRISVYENSALIARSTVSTGVPRHPTPVGVFSVISKQRWHRSNIYSGAPMPYMQRITWSGIALHAGIVPGHPASHGCIRLRNDLAIRLWHLTKRGTRVIIAPDDIRPVEIAHPRLFVPKPRTAFGPPEAPAATPDDVPATRAVAQSASMSTSDAQQGTDAPASTTGVGAADAPRKITPVSVFVSGKSRRLFVRQGFRPLFDSPVSIQNPDQLLGTHVFTAMGLQNGGETLRWTAVSMPEKSARRPSKGRARGKQQVEEPSAPLSSPEKANAALDRIEIPEDVVERISKLLTPGSSLIVSDYGISGETGKDTDFIVVIK